MSKCTNLTPSFLLDTSNNTNVLDEIDESLLGTRNNLLDEDSFNTSGVDKTLIDESLLGMQNNSSAVSDNGVLFTSDSSHYELSCTNCEQSSSTSSILPVII